MEKRRENVDTDFGVQRVNPHRVSVHLWVQMSSCQLSGKLNNKLFTLGELA